MTRAQFVNELCLEARKGGAVLYVSYDDAGVKCRRQVAGLHRNGQRILFATVAGYGLTIHRDAGISFVGIPRSGGTSILWGAANRKVKHEGRDHRAFHLGLVGIYVGSDF